MDLEFIERVIRLVEDAEISELELESQEGLRIVVRKTSSGAGSAPAPMMMMSPYFGGNMPYPAPQPTTTEPAAKTEDANIEIIKAPMVGTFYRAPSPDSPPFVEVGRQIQNSSVVCILEAMKVMNEIKSGMSGTIVEILIDNGQAVEFGQPLFKVRKS